MRVLTTIIATAAFTQICSAQTGPVTRQPPAKVTLPDDAQTRSTITVRPGYAATITLSEPFATLVVGDPELIDAIATTDRVFVIKAKSGAAGTSNVVVMNTVGQQILDLNVRVAASESGLVKVHYGHSGGAQGGSSGAFQLHDVIAYNCTPSACVWLGKDKERISIQTRQNILGGGTTTITESRTER